MEDKGEFIFAAKLGRIIEEELVEVTLNGKPVILAAAGDDVFALDGICTHADAHLVDGYLEGTTVECPMHGGSFDIRTGQPTAPPCFESLETYPVRIDGDDVLVGVPAL